VFKKQLDLFDPPAIAREAELPAGMFFNFGGRALKTLKTYGTDAAAPVIFEEITDAVTLKGQLAIWSVDGVRRAQRGRK
jgi:hypothetical protein